MLRGPRPYDLVFELHSASTLPDWVSDGFGLPRRRRVHLLSILLPGSRRPGESRRVCKCARRIRFTNMSASRIDVRLPRRLPCTRWWDLSMRGVLRQLRADVTELRCRQLIHANRTDGNPSQDNQQINEVLSFYRVPNARARGVWFHRAPPL